MAGVDHVQARARHLAQQAIEETICGRFAALESKKAFNEEVRNSYATALANLTNDLIAHGEHDLLPRYLKEQLGTKEEGRYLDVHKHSWETSVKTCLDRLRELLRAEGLEPE
jgi:hypothetical protein